MPPPCTAAAWALAPGGRALLTLHAPQALGLSFYERAWWDQAHQHFTVTDRAGLFKAITPASTCRATDVEGGAGELVSAVQPESKGVLVAEARGALFAKYSLNKKLLAIQVGESSLVVCELGLTAGLQADQRSPLRTWRVGCKGGAVLLPGGVVWSEHGGNSQDLVLVTTLGAEFYKVSSKRGQCKHIRTLSYSTRWWW
mmetsp:Transcript_42019/g.94933  ORF Transcript_42019/g.94933 Transcript_42019/m.94933 type:complete len:199 (+) Transcript_42019:65-661(+)